MAAQLVISGSHGGNRWLWAASYSPKEPPSQWACHQRLWRRLSTGVKSAFHAFNQQARAEQIFARPPRAATPTLPARPPTAIYDNMLAEARRGVPVAMHAYYHANATTGVVEDEAQHVAAFMLLRQENWYFLGSTGWFDKDYRWSRLYDLACGRPAAPASSPREGVYERAYEACSVTLDCTAALNASAKPQPPCSASIVGPAAPSWPAVVVESARA